MVEQPTQGHLCRLTTTWWPSERQHELQNSLSSSIEERSFVLKVSGSARTVTVANLLVSQVELPKSFLAGWADYEAGRVVDMERALEDEPPPPAM